MDVFVRSVIALGIVLLPGCCSDNVFLSDPTNVTALEYDPVVLECKLSVEPAYGIFWLKEGTIIANARKTPNSEAYRVEGTGFEYNLHILNVTVASEGKYGCQVLTEDGTFLQQHYITVHIPPSIQVTPTVSAVDVSLGGNLVVLCKATAGRPKPTITWRKVEDGSAVDFIMESDRLEFTGAQKNMTGLYTCEASNDAGSAEKEISINVRYGPTIEVDQSFIHTAPGQNIELKCTFWASPTVDVEWHFDRNGSRKNLEIKDEEMDDATISVVHVRNVKVEDLGEYECAGANEWGITAGLIAVSGIPHNLTIVSGKESMYVNQYTLEWTVVSLPSIVEFIVLLEESRGSEIIQREETIPAVNSGNTDQPIHDQMYVINGLEKNTTYELKLIAYNVVGNSGWTEKFTFHTPAEGKVAEPTEDSEVDSPDPTEVSSSSRSSTHVAAVLFLLALTLFL